MDEWLISCPTTLPMAKDQHTPPSQYPLNENQFKIKYPLCKMKTKQEWFEFACMYVEEGG